MKNLLTILLVILFIPQELSIYIEKEVSLKNKSTQVETLKNESTQLATIPLLSTGLLLNFTSAFLSQIKLIIDIIGFFFNEKRKGSDCISSSAIMLMTLISSIKIIKAQFKGIFKKQFTYRSNSTKLSLALLSTLILARYLKTEKYKEELFISGISYLGLCMYYLGYKIYKNHQMKIYKKSGQKINIKDNIEANKWRLYHKKEV